MPSLHMNLHSEIKVPGGKKKTQLAVNSKVYYKNDDELRQLVKLSKKAIIHFIIYHQVNAPQNVEPDSIGYELPQTLRTKQKCKHHKVRFSQHHNTWQLNQMNIPVKSLQHLSSFPPSYSCNQEL